METTKKGYDSLKADIDRDMKSEPHRWNGRLERILALAQTYADVCHVTRQEVLEKWETNRSYWWPNYYQECNFPDLNKKGGYPVLTLEDWIKEGERLFGPDKKNWKFICPNCGHIQSYRDFIKGGINADLAALNCASRHGLGGRPDCKWTTGGLFRIGGCYVINKDYIPVLVFAFADKANKEKFKNKGGKASCKGREEPKRKSPVRDTK